MLGNQGMYQNCFSARTKRDARVFLTGWTLGTLLLEKLIVAIAVVGRALYPAIYTESILQKMLYAYTIYSAALKPVVATACGTRVTHAWNVPGVKTIFSCDTSPAGRDFSGADFRRRGDGDGELGHRSPAAEHWLTLTSKVKQRLYIHNSG